MSWPRAPLGELVLNQDSRRIPLKQSDRALRKGNIPYYGASGVIDYIDEYIFDGEFLLIGEDGANLLARSTPIAFHASGKIWVNNHAHIVESNGKADLRFLAYYLNRISLEPYVTGSAQPKLNRSKLDSIEIPLPPLPEQKRIAAILDKADAIRRKRQQAIKLADAFLRSVFLDMFGDPLTNPKGWVGKPLHEVCSLVVDCPHSTPQWTASGVIGLRTSNLTKGGWAWEDKRFISEETYQERTRRAALEPGDIVLSREGTVGIAAIVPEGERMCMGQRLVQLRCKPDVVSSEYLLLFLLYELEPERIARVMAGSTSKHLNVKDLKNLKVMLPDKKLQDKFSEILRKLRITELSSGISNLKLEALFGALSQKAFTSEA